MKEKINELLNNGPNLQRKNLREFARAFVKAQDAFDEMEQAMLKLCLSKRVHDSWTDSDRPQDDQSP